MLTLTDDEIETALALEERGWVPQHHSVMAIRSPEGGIGSIVSLVEVFMKDSVELQLCWSGPHSLKWYAIDNQGQEAVTFEGLLRDVQNAC